MRVRTAFSTYEVDGAGSRIRRLGGDREPTERQGQDGEWKKYHALLFPADGSMLIVWDSGGHSTLTSPIVCVE